MLIGGKMKVLIYRYGSIYEPSVIDGFKSIGCEVNEFREVMFERKISYVEEVELLKNLLFAETYDFVFSINFFPIVSSVCNIFRIPYLSWVVDSPLMELYSETIKNPCNGIFCFDYEMFQKFSPRNPDGIFYLPLGSDVTRMQKICQTISPKDRETFSSDISFIGSLYSEKCPYNDWKPSNQRIQGYVEGIIESQLRIYGTNFIEELVNEEVIEEFKKGLPYFYPFGEKDDPDERAVVADHYIGNKVTEQERIRVLDTLSQRFDVYFYTQSDTSMLKSIHNRGEANSVTEMPKIFNLSKININFTSKPIKSGLPLRIWDIMACEGFVLSNYQSEIPEYFEIGREIETFSSTEELIDKCAYYLSHEEERSAIAQRGFEKVCREHTVEQRLQEIVSCL